MARRRNHGSTTSNRPDTRENLWFSSPKFTNLEDKGGIMEDDPETTCIKIFDGPTIGATLAPRMRHVAPDSPEVEPDGTWILTLEQPKSPGAMRITAALEPHMHAKLDVQPSPEPEPGTGKGRLGFTLTITGTLTDQGIQGALRDQTGDGE
jgi:hypothetical protein